LNIYVLFVGEGHDAHSTTCRAGKEYGRRQEKAHIANETSRLILKVCVTDDAVTNLWLRN
jgi:hypothetical protein